MQTSPRPQFASSLPEFMGADDPGSSFLELLRRSRPDLAMPQLGANQTSMGQTSPPFDIAHATTIVAIRCATGVVMAGDRRATAGHAIAGRRMEKVAHADAWSGVAIAGAAGLAVDMVRLFQTQLEHYEKVQGAMLSLEGKANQLAQMVRANLAMAMQGFVVVPLFAGYDTRREQGRAWHGCAARTTHPGDAGTPDRGDDSVPAPAGRAGRFAHC